MPEERVPIITLTTDFGQEDAYAAIMKGVILSINPKAKIVDICHGIGAHDLLEGAFVLGAAYSVFPLRTIHVCVVDPGVGTARRPILAVTEKYYFLAPDNGVLSFIYEKEVVEKVYVLEAEHYRREPVSPTFHGRDIFAPAAAWLTRGADAENFGMAITDYARITVPKPKVAERGLDGMVLHVDRFGNLVTNISADDLARLREMAGGAGAVTVRIKDKAATLQETYMGGAEGPVAVVGSSGYVEVAMPKQSAHKALGAGRGERVRVEV